MPQNVTSQILMNKFCPILTIRDDKFRREALNKRYVLKDFLEKAQVKRMYIFKH